MHSHSRPHPKTAIYYIHPLPFSGLITAFFGSSLLCLYAHHLYSTPAHCTTITQYAISTYISPPRII